MKQKNKKLSFKKNRERCIGPLIHIGVDTDYVKIFSWINIVLCAFFCFLGFLEDKKLTIVLFGSSVIINIISLIIAFLASKNILLKITSYLLMGLCFMTMIFWVEFIGLELFVTNEEPISFEQTYSSPLTLIYTIVMLVLFSVSCGIYSWYYLPQNQGKRWKFNQ